MKFLPTTKQELADLGWDWVDFIIVTGDAYVDHPSFGTAIIGRVLESEGFRVAVISQPDWSDKSEFMKFGRPRLGFLVNSGNIDSMVAHYTVALKKRNYDYYSPGGKPGLRPDRAVIVYCNRIREAYGDIPLIIGGVEASTRRFAHYDYWSDKIRRSILMDSRADLLSYGMGENSIRRIAFLLDKGVPIKKLRDIRGTAFITGDLKDVHFKFVQTDCYQNLKSDKNAYAKSFIVQLYNQDHIHGEAVVEEYDGKYLVQNPPMPPLTRKELDFVYSLPYMRDYHPIYEPFGGIPAIEEVKFSITHCRGCFGACNFCSIAFHQGRTVTSRSIASVVEETEKITKLPGFKGYIHDVGGPTANFRNPSCNLQKTNGVCREKKCLFPEPCANLNHDHSDYIELLKQVEKVDGVKKVFIRSGIRFDYMMLEKNNNFFKKLVKDHISGQLKVAPEHICNNVLAFMGKPNSDVYDDFKNRFYSLTSNYNKEQYLVPYLMSSHPGSTLDDAIELALYLKKNKINPQQVQDFYPTPGTASTCMYYTEMDPFTMNPVYVPKTYEEKSMQRALLQFNKAENQKKVIDALKKSGKEDLIGNGKDCLIPPINRFKHKKNI